MRASHDLFTLHLLGYDKLRTYLGSWDEWKSRRPARRRREHREGFRRSAHHQRPRHAAARERDPHRRERPRDRGRSGASTSVPSGAEQIDVSGRTIVPGFINAHGHVGDTRDWKAAPSLHRGECARPARALREAVSRPSPVLAATARPVSHFATRSERRHSIWRASWLRVRSLTRRRQRRLARKSTRLRQRSRTSSRSAWTTTSGPPRRCRWRPQCCCRRAGAQARPQGRRAHLLSGRRQGAGTCRVDMLAHSVRDKPVDDELIKLLKARDACVCPTLMREVSTFAGRRRSFFRIRSSSDRPIRSCSRSPRSEAAGDRPHEPGAAYTPRRSTSRPNLKRLADAGVRIVWHRHRPAGAIPGVLRARRAHADGGEGGPHAGRKRSRRRHLMRPRASGQGSVRRAGRVGGLHRAREESAREHPQHAID